MQTPPGVGNASITPVGGENVQSLYLICQGVCPPGILRFSNRLGKSTVASPLAISTFMQTPFAISTFANGRWGNQHLQTHLGNRLLKPPWEIDFENRPPFKQKGRLQR